MLDFSGSTTICLACGITDLRRSYSGLAVIIKLKFHLDPYSRCMFAFCNCRRTLIKILQWDGSGFWILMKRLDCDSFHWPDTPDKLQIRILQEKTKELEFLNAMLKILRWGGAAGCFVKASAGRRQARLCTA